MLEWACSPEITPNGTRAAFPFMAGGPIVIMSQYRPGSRGWHFYCFCDQELTYGRSITVEVSLARSEAFLSHLPVSLRYNPDSAGTLFVNDAGEFVAYAVNGEQGPSVLAGNWVGYARFREPAYRLAEAICREMGWEREFSRSYPARPPLLIGADPEFEIVAKDGSLIPAITIFNQDDEIGADATEKQLEVRPDPAETPDKLYRRIIRLVRRAKRIVASWGGEGTILISGHQLPLGCHIHIGAGEGKYYAINFDEFAAEVDRVQTPLGQLGDLLLELSGRARGTYAVRAAYEDGKSHGGGEYRTPPSSILAFPETFEYVAGVCLAIAKGESLPPFPEQKFRELLELVRSGKEFGIGGRIFRPICSMRLSDRDYWSDTWQLVAGQARPPQNVYLFGFSGDRGDVTNRHYLAQHFGWDFIDFYSDEVGLPRSARGLNDPEAVREIVEVILEKEGQCA